METKPSLDSVIQFKASDYTVTVTLLNAGLCFKAFLNSTGGMLEANIADHDLNEFEQDYFGGCEGVFEAIQECVTAKGVIELNDA